MFVDMRAASARDLAVHDKAYPGWARRQMRAGRLVPFLVENASHDILGGGSVWLREVQPFPGFKGGKVPYLMSMYTNPEYRGKGIATMIVKKAIAWSRAHGYGSVTLHSSDMGRPLYEKLGWEATTEMELDLAKVPNRSGHH